MSSQVIIKPTFLLKGIDPFSLTEEYHKGNILRDLSLEKKKIASVVLTSNRGKSFRDAIYTFRNKDNFINTIATTNAKSFSFVDSDGTTIKGGQCMNCLDHFTHEGLGIPVTIKEDRNGKIIVHTISKTCDFRCTLRQIRLLQQQPYRYRKVNFTHSEQILKLIYRKMHPDAPQLIEAPDPLLAEWNGGSLNREEYKDSRFIYIHIPNLCLIPAKEQFMRINAVS